MIHIEMKKDESVSEMFHRLQVLVNYLKALGEKVEDKDFSHKFLRCLPSRFGILVTILVRSGLNTMTPNQMLGDIMTDNTYRDNDEKEEKKEKRDEKKRLTSTPVLILPDESSSLVLVN